MSIDVGTLVALPRFSPYPRFGRVAAVIDEQVHVERVQCGDPRCAAEHAHGAQVWDAQAVEAVDAYQPRAHWEQGRKASANTPLD